MADAGSTHLAPVAAEPYPWPFDGKWSPADTALLLLGFQQAPIAALDAEGQLDIARRLLEKAAHLGIAVVAARRGYGPEESPLAARRRQSGDLISQRGGAGWTLDARIALPPDVILVDIAGDNAFFGTGLEEALRRRGIRNLIVTGLPTEGLVHSTQRAANDMGFECLTVSDACKGTSLRRHSAQLRITTFGNGLFGTVAHSTDILAVIGDL